MATKMPFGKHKDQPLEEIPSRYLVWLLEEVELRPPLKAAVREELGRRYALPPAADPPARPSRQCADPVLAHEVITAGYRTLAKRHHPDVGGDLRTMQAVNAIVDWLKGLV